MEIHERRRLNLLKILEAMPAAELSRTADNIAESMITGYRKEAGEKGARNIGEAVARKLERAARKPEGWLDKPPGWTQADVPALERVADPLARLGDAIELIGMALAKADPRTREAIAQNLSSWAMHGGAEPWGQVVLNLIEHGKQCRASR